MWQPISDQAGSDGRMNMPACTLHEIQEAVSRLAGLLLDLEDTLGVPVDLVPTARLDQRFLDSIRDDEVLLYEAS